MPQIEIKRRWIDAVLFTFEATDEQQASGLAMRHALEAANKARANLDGANLAGANLAGAYLVGANLDGANLAGAYLVGAYLDGANLDGANLAGANLAGANLDGANLAGAYLVGANLDGAYLAGAKLRDGLLTVGQRPLLQIGPIGSRSAFLSVWLTDKGVRLQTGCFWGAVEVFEAAVSKEHGAESIHGCEYTAAIELAKVHAQLWTTVAEVAKPVAEPEAA